jgi:hypothetical protein
MQEREELRALKREKKMSREGKIKKERKIEKKRKNIYMYEKEKKKREKRSGNKDMREMNQVKEKIIKCKEGCHVVERRNFHSFSNHVQSDNEDVIGAS